MYLRLVLAALAVGLGIPQPGADAQFNNPPGVDIWCGKAYRATNASFNPGGFFEEPPRSTVPLLNLKIRPRMNIYVEDDGEGSFLVDTEISHFVGQPLGGKSDSTPAPGEKLLLSIMVDENSVLVKNQSIDIGLTEYEIPFQLRQLPARKQPYNISVTATSTSRGSTFSASTQLFRLPSRSDGGSTTKLDNLYGGLHYRTGNATEWTPIFPYTYYVQWSLYWFANLSTLDDFSARGYNVIHIVPTGDLGNTPFPWDELMPYLDRAAMLGLLFQFDVRFDPGNSTTMIDIVTRLQNHPSILLWYTGDEPDGKSNPLNSTLIAYNTINSIDGYHPVSLALNCYDFYYTEYASGAEIILSDVYPVSTNTSFSTVYGTPCNLTYGDCGCDDCHGSFEDIADRLDNFAHFDSLIGWDKTHWGAPQAFGNETFWPRYPTGEEELAMTMMYINHGAKGIVMWDFPTTSDILSVTDSLSKILPSEEVAQYLIGASILRNLDVQGATGLDVAAWVLQERRSLLISIININNEDIGKPITISLPDDMHVSSIIKNFLGNAHWTVQHGMLSSSKIPGLDVSVIEVAI